MGGDQLRRECLVQLSVLNATEAVVPIDAGPIAPHLYNQEQLAKLDRNFNDSGVRVSSALGRSLAKPDRIRKLFHGMRRPESPRRSSSRLLTPHHREGKDGTMEEALQHLVRVEGITVT